jgi:uncharacterized membrane protein
MNKVYSNLGKLVTVDFLLNKWLEWTELSLLCEEAVVEHFIKNLDIRYYNVNNIMRGIQT